MEVVALLHTLWRHRVWVLVAAVVAGLLGYAIAFRPPTLESRQYEVGLGSASALVDTPSSQVVDLGGGETGTDIRTLAARATLLASLVTSSPIKDEVAKRAGVDPQRLIAVPPSGESVGTKIAPSALTARDAIVLKARVPTLESGEVPIIAVDTQAPDADLAAKLADAAFAALKDRLQSVAGTDNVPDARRVVVTQLGPARATSQVQGVGPMIGFVAFVFLFGVGCLVIVGVEALVNGWRQAAVMDLFPDGEDPFDDDAFDDDAFDTDEPRLRAAQRDPRTVEDREPTHPDVVGF